MKLGAGLWSSEPTIPLLTGAADDLAVAATSAAMAREDTLMTTMQYVLHMPLQSESLYGTSCHVVDCRSAQARLHPFSISSLCSVRMQARGKQGAAG